MYCIGLKYSFITRYCDSVTNIFISINIIYKVFITVKYILTEKQLEVVEIGTARGRYDTSPENALWDSFEDKLKKKHKIESFKKYYSKVLGNDTKKIGDKIFF